MYCRATTTRALEAQQGGNNPEMAASRWNARVVGGSIDDAFWIGCSDVSDRRTEAQTQL